MRDLLKKYIDSNKKILLIYIGICFSFYSINFAFFRNNLDAPVDLIFAVIFIFVASGTVILFTLFNTNMLNSSNKVFVIFVNFSVPFLISTVFAMIYWLIEMQDSASLLQFLFLQLVAFPLMCVSVIIMIIFKYYKIGINKIFLIGATVILVYYVFIYGLGVIETQTEDSSYTLFGYALLFLVIPFGYMMYLIKKLDVISH